MNNFNNDILNFKKVLDDRKSLNINDLNLNKTSLIIVDMNNGFAKHGNLYSPRVNKLISPICELTQNTYNKLNQIIAFTDYHTPNSVELLSFPNHCLFDSDESDLIDELKNIPNLKIIRKNSTNGFFNLDNKFEDDENIIIVGDCTDICIYQLAITLKGYYNENDIPKNIIVPMDLVDTYDIINVHPGDLLNIVFLNSMIQNGINVVSKINFV